MNHMSGADAAFAVGVGFNAVNIILIIFIIYILITLAKVLRKLDKALDIWLSKHRDDQR